MSKCRPVRCISRFSTFRSEGALPKPKKWRLSEDFRQPLSFVPLRKLIRTRDPLRGETCRTVSSASVPRRRQNRMPLRGALGGRSAPRSHSHVRAHRRLRRLFGASVRSGSALRPPPPSIAGKAGAAFFDGWAPTVRSLSPDSPLDLRSAELRAAGGVSRSAHPVRPRYRLRTRRTVDWVVWRMKTFGPIWAYLRKSGSV